MKKAESPTGLKGRSGFTLIEVLFAILILSSGILFITPAFFRSGGILAHLASVYEAGLLADNLIAENEENLRKFHLINETVFRGQIQSQDILYSVEAEASPQDSPKHIYLLRVRVAWKDFRQNQLERSVLILR